jgi:biopolymer transport protein ExbB
MRNIKLLFALSFSFLFFINLFGQPAGYNFGKQVLIQASQVAGGTPLTNFPVLIHFTDPDLRTVANSGSVENANGYDIIFTLSDCTTQLDHQIERYNAATGEYIAWVKIPSLSNSTNTNIHMYYGNSGVSANPSVSSTWNVGYDGVWHLNNTFVDASGNGNNGTNNGSVNMTPANNTGNGRNFTDPNHWIELPSHPNRNNSFSYTAWIRTADNTRAGQRVICDDATNANGCHALSVGDPGTGMLRFYIRGMNPVSLDSPGGTINNNTWHYVAGVYDHSTRTKFMYVDGALITSAVVTGAFGTPTGNASIGGEVAAGETANRFHGDIDEVRAIPAVLSASWIATEYNNQNSPSTFYAVSAQMSASVLCATLPTELLRFTCYATENKTVAIEWETASEVNNDYFTIERSKDGKTWHEIERINGAGTSSTHKNYATVDENPFDGISYYRLKQTDFDGSFDYSQTVTVNFDDIESSSVFIYPNPTSNKIIVEANEHELQQLKVYDMLGQEVTLLTSQSSLQNNKIEIDLSGLSSGVYFIKTTTTTSRVVKQTSF